jgi:hypothetical protein
MSDEPSARAQWNMRMLVNLIVLVAYLGLLALGVVRESLTIADALALLGSTALGGGIGWFSK